MTKLFKRKNIMNLIYALIIAVPIFSILVRSAYVVVNKNAYQNYSGKDEIIDYVNTDIVELGEDYRFKPAEYTINHNLTLEFVNNGAYAKSDLVQSITNTNKIILRTDGTIVFYENGTWLNEVNYANNMFYIDMELTAYYPNANADYEVLKLFLTIPSNINNYLDNAFDYSLSKFVDENSFGKLNFFEWFFNIFMDSNQLNNLYIRYVNWYMNYVLLVSCSYILFLVLMWFVNYSRRILERGLDYDW